MYIFISHSSKDANIASELCTILEANGCDCFLAPRNIRPGYEYATEIIDGIDRSNVMMLLLSNNSMNSPHVLREIERAVSKSIPIIVYKLEEVVLSKSYEYFLMSHQWLDAEHCRYDALLKSIRDLSGDESTTNEANSQIASTTPIVTPTSSSKKESRSSKWIGVVIGIAIIILLSVILGVMIADSKDDGNTNDDDTLEVTSDTPGDSPEPDSSETNSPVDIQTGDTIIFGKYNNSEIEWKVLKISDDGTEAVLISKDILSFKAFDGANSGTYDYVDSSTDALTQIEASGSNIWRDSAIRTWLNSDKDYVQYEGGTPTDRAMTDQNNGYDMEAGFLYNFTSEEIATIKETTIKTKGNYLSEDNIITTMDKVFVLSLDELNWFEKAGVSILAAPTEEAIKNNESSFYEEYAHEVFFVDTWNWWLRDPVADSVRDCYQVGHGAKEENIYTSVVSADGYGIRPAITVDLTSDALRIDE